MWINDSRMPKKLDWHWFTTQLQRSLRTRLWRMTRRGLQLSASTRKIKVVLLHASPMTHTTTFAIKTFTGLPVASKGHWWTQKSITKMGSMLLQMVLKQRPTYLPINVTKELKTQFVVKLKYSIVWCGKEMAQNQLYSLACHPCESLRW